MLYNAISAAAANEFTVYPPVEENHTQIAHDELYVRCNSLLPVSLEGTLR